MQTRNIRHLSGLSLISTTIIFSPLTMANTIAEAVDNGKAYGDFRLRYESVTQDNAKKDADALTLRSRLGYATDKINGFSATLEFEDSRTVAGIDNYNNAIGEKSNYSVIADPETTELDQAFIQYSGHGLNSKLGRQVLHYDNHRFVGHVGWRQDRQTFDGISFNYHAIDNVVIDYAYIEKRNRIFAEEKDINSKDHLFNASYKTSLGKIAAYSYLLKEDTSLETAIDTYGIRFAGSTGNDIKFIYSVEYASQEKSDDNNVDFDANYLLLESGLIIGGITAKLGYEILGSDNGQYGFSTPLATLHKFNGWSDQFLSTPKEGLIDAYACVSGKFFGGDWILAYHDFSAEEDSPTVDNLGNEINIAYTKKFAKHYKAGVKYAAYSADDKPLTYVDSDKIWLSISASF